MQIKAYLVEKTSKSGNRYTCVEIQLTDKLKKIVFLTPAELELIKLTNTNK